MVPKSNVTCPCERHTGEETQAGVKAEGRWEGHPKPGNPWGHQKLGKVQKDPPQELMESVARGHLDSWTLDSQEAGGTNSGG